MGKQSEAIASALTRTVEMAVKALTLEIDARLRRATPVDTGHARANWVPSIGAPHTGEVQGNGAHESGVARIVAFKLGDGPTFISNNVPYLGRLNDGHSKQAPSGFIERAIDEAFEHINQKFAGRGVVLGTYQSHGATAAVGVAGSYTPEGL